MSTTEIEQRRQVILDEILEKRVEYQSLRKRYPLIPANEVIKYSKTQDPLPKIPNRYMRDLMADIKMSQKIQSLIGLLDKAFDITNQERECLQLLVKEQIEKES